MDQINSFEGGLNTDSAPERQDKNTYRYLLNGVDTSDKGDLLKITSEKGTIIFSELMGEDGWKVIGKSQINNDIILFFVRGVKGDSNYGSRIGIIDYQGIYTTKVDDPLLGFNIDWPIQAEARITFNNHRVVYFVDNNNTDRRVDLDSTEPFNVAEASLSANTSLPIVNFIKFNDGNAGQLYTGVYQFIARYLNDDLSSSSFGFLSNPIPVVDDLRSVGRDAYDGAPIDTLVNNKTIQLQLTNLDSNKSTIEIIAIRYTGLAQTAVIKRFYQGNFSGTTLDVEFTGLEETVDVALEEVIVEPVAYISSKTITQKDNRLIRANLKGRTAPNLQQIANGISVSYDVVEEVYQQDNTQYFDDYKGEMQTFNKKTYMSEEVYAPAFRVVYKDGTKSLAYHIAAQNPDETWKSADDYSITLPGAYNPTTTSLGQKWYPGNFNTQTDGIGNKSNLALGTYISQLKYEPNKGYPSTGISDGNGVFIRFILMPPVDIEPHFRNVGDVQYIRYKALRFSTPDFSMLSEDERNDIVGYEILRADRDINNRSILSQGIIQRAIKFDSVDMGQQPSPYPFGEEFYMEAPGLSNFEVDTDGSQAVNDVGGDGDAGFYSSRNFHPTDNTADPNYTSLKKYKINRNSYLPDLVTYYSPDFILGNVTLDPLSFKEKLLIKGQCFSPDLDLATGTGFITTGNFNNINKNNYGFNLFCDYDEKLAGRNIKFDTAGQFYYYNNTVQDQEQSFNIPFGANTRKVFENFNTGHYWLRVNGGTVYQDTNYIDIFLRMNNDDPGAQDDDYDSNISAIPVDNTKALINLQKNLSQQYGPLGNLEYLPIAVVPVKEEIPSQIDGGNNQLRIFNGDIFISKFFVKNSTLLNVKIYAKEGGFPANRRSGKGIDHFPPYSGMPIQSGSYFFVESVVNTNYRHQIPATPPSVVTGIPYYPKYDENTSLNTDPKYSHPSGYNLLYSKNNNLKTVPERPFGFVSVSNYPNRMIYSQQAIESEQLDAYRLFLANNFHDVPKNKGEIWNIFNFNNILYAHCPKTLWRTFTNEPTALTGAYNTGDIYVGNAGMFPRPSVEVLTLAGGYAGTISQFAGVQTPSGYVFPDILQGKIFKLNQGLEEVSTAGVQVFFNENLNYYINTETGKYIDNPFKPNEKGIMGVYDAYRKRYILTNHDTESFTISYSFIANKWRSYHSYMPHLYVSNDNRFFAVDNSETQIKLYEHNKGEYLKFYNNSIKSPFILHFVENAQGRQIIPDNMVINSICKSADEKTYVHLTQFDKIRVYNEKQNSDYINIVTTNSNTVAIAKNEIKSSEKNNSFLVAFPKNAVLLDNSDIFDPSNLEVNRLFKDRIKGFYALVELTYTPNEDEDRKFTLNFIKTSSRVNNFL